MLRFDDRWIWDFWMARRGAEHHVFYLQAPRSLGDPDKRHRNATIGHAVSTNLRDWTVLADALGPGPAGAWDDDATWTGSILERDGHWWLYYTGISTNEDGLVQRVGVATSDDLTTWTKHPGNPIIELDPVRYEALDLTAWPDQAWRDPWVVPLNGGFHALLTARAATGDYDARGVVAHARSTDLVTWAVDDPVTITPSGQFGQLEVPQLIELGGRWYLLFCTGEGTHSHAWAARTGKTPRTGTYYAVADSPLGPFTLVDEMLLGPRDGSTCYAGRIVPTDDGPMFMAWRLLAPDGSFAGELIDPIPVGVMPDGALTLDGKERSRV
jgi:beta-fructofuranosidase